MLARAGNLSTRTLCHTRRHPPVPAGGSALLAAPRITIIAHGGQGARRKRNWRHNKSDQRRAVLRQLEEHRQQVELQERLQLLASAVACIVAVYWAVVGRKQFAALLGAGWLSMTKLGVGLWRLFQGPI